MLNGVARSTGLSLLAKFSLGNCLYVRVGLSGVLTRGIHARNLLIVVWCWVEELLGCHHHLLLILVSIWCFPLIHQIEQMGLIILGNTVSCTDSVVANTAWVNAKWAGSISVTCVGDVLMVHLLKWLSSLMLLSLEIIHILLSSIALSDVFHEVTIVHGVSHLCLVLLSFVWGLRISETTNSCLVEHLLFLSDLTINMREHLMNSWVISRLEENTMMSCVHLINAKRPITSCIASSLLPHSVCHEESLIWFLSTEHSIYSLSGWLTLSTSDVGLVVLVNQGISKRAVGHGMFVHVVVLKIRHHISKSCLSSWFSPLLLYFVHLLQVLFGCWVKLWSESFLCLERTCFWFWDLVDFEATAHGWMHHDLAWSLDLLKAIQCDIIQVACTVQISLLVSHHLLEEAVTSSLPLFLLKEKVICWCDLIVFIILDIRYSLC